MKRRLIAAATTALTISLTISLTVPAGADAAGVNRANTTDQANRGTATSSERASHRIEQLRLTCAADVGTSTIACNWSAPTSDAAAGVKLVRVELGARTARETVFRTNDLDVTSFVDDNVDTGVRYRYVAIAVNEDGRLIGRSRAATAGIGTPSRPEIIRLKCRLDRTAQTAMVGCKWSEPTSDDATEVTLWRSVDGQAREAVAAFDATGPFTTTDVAPDDARRIRYAITVEDDSGTLVGRSRISQIRIPQ